MLALALLCNCSIAVARARLIECPRLPKMVTIILFGVLSVLLVKGRFAPGNALPMRSSTN